jgi:ribokinase
MAGAVVVVGSLNMDFVVTVEHLPAPGETVLGRDFQMIPGGKGANQACAAGKLAAVGVPVRMIGRVGCDVFAGQLKASLSAAGVDVSGVHAARNHATGVALIWVDRAGQNSIVVAPGANSALAAADVADMREVFRGGSHALFQLETPLATVAAALALARAEGLVTILDPAPAQPMPRDLLEQVDIVTPNESEALLLLGRPPARVTLDDAPALSRELLQLGPRAVILKLGDQGCFYSAGEECCHQAAFPVEARDTTAAGDTFNAALAIALAEGRPMPAALRFAAAAAAISVTRLGAQSSAPTRAETEALVA